MIDYSLGLRASNPQMTDSEKKAYAYAQARETLNITQLAKHIQDHGSVFTKDTIVGCITAVVDCIREQLLAGNRIQVGDLGTFYVTLSSDGVANAHEFNPATHISAVNVKWDCGTGFDDLRQDATFNLVSTRKEQREQKKLMKEALNEEMGYTSPSTTDDPDNPTGTGDPGDITP